MSGSRSSCSTVAPKAGSREFDRVLALGCDAEPDYWGEVSCPHDYWWDCDDCPVVVERMRLAEVEWFREIMDIAGPPRHLSHPGELFYTPAVAAELVWMYGDEASFLSVSEAARALPPKSPVVNSFL